MCAREVKSRSLTLRAAMAGTRLILTGVQWTFLIEGQSDGYSKASFDDGADALLKVGPVEDESEFELAYILGVIFAPAASRQGMRHHLESAEAAELSQLSAGESTPARQCFGGRMSRTSRSGSASNVTKNIITIIASSPSPSAAALVYDAPSLCLR